MSTESNTNIRLTYDLTLILLCYTFHTNIADAAIAARAADVAAAAASHKTTTKANIMPDSDDNAVPSSAWESVNHSDFHQNNDDDEATPPCAGSPSKNADANPTYYAWNVQPAPTEAPVPQDGEPTGDVMTHYKVEPESEYHQAFRYEAGHNAEHVKKSTDLTLKGVFHDGSDGDAPATESVPEPVAAESDAATSDERNIIGGTDHYNDIPLSENTAAFRFDATSATYTEHVKKSADTTLEGVFKYEPATAAVDDAGAVGSDAGSEVDIIGGTAHYKDTPLSENTAAFRYDSESAPAVNHVHKDSDATLIGVFSYANIGSTMESENHAAFKNGAESALEPVVEAPVASEPVAAPIVEEDMKFEASETAVEEPLPVREMASEAPLSVSEPTVASEATEPTAPISNPWMAPTGVVYQSVSNSSFQWPSNVTRPDRGTVVDADMMGGTAASAPQGDLVEEMANTLAPAEPSRFQSEYNSNFSMPKDNMNKRAVKKYPDSLWVLGTKGDAKLRDPPAPKAKRAMGDAEIDHLRGSAAMPHASDSLVFNTIREKVPPSKVKSSDPIAGYVPGGEKNVLRSDGVPIPGQIPFLREKPDPISIINSAAAKRTPTVFASAGLPPGTNVADPINMFQRYPIQSVKQANRFATTSRAAYKWPNK